MATLLQDPSSGPRPLNPEERADLEAIVGDKIDYDKVRGKDGKYLGLLGAATTPNNTIHWPGCGETSFCGDRPTFMHEMTHVLQHQQGVNVRLRGSLLHTASFLTFGAYDRRCIDI